MNDKHKWTCENCGELNDAHADVCSECGWDKFADDDWDPSEGQYVGDT